MTANQNTLDMETLQDPAGFPSSTPVYPLRLFVLTVALVFATELGIMVWLEILWQAPEMLEVVIGSIVLTCVVAPLLYGTLYRPLNRYVAQVRRAGEALRYSEKKYQTVVEDSPAGIFIYRDGQIVFANQRLRRMLGEIGVSPEGPDLLETVPAEDQARLHALVNPAAVPAGDAPEIEFRVRPRDGRVRWLSGRTRRIRYKGAGSVLGMVLDITARKELEEEVRHLSAQRLQVQEEERGRVARELHDGVGQSLSGIKFLVEHTIGTAYPGERRGQMESLRKLVPKLQDTVEEVRRMSMALRPSTLDDLGLLATIRWFLRELRVSCPHIAVEQRLEVVEPEIPEALKIVIYRTLQEALNNAAKHCGECNVEVVLEHRAGGLQLAVADDGDGFDPGSVRRRDPASRGFGLASMRERVELSGGVFQVTAAPGAGTRVRAEWPPEALTARE
jgi:PAS domain S-box-containing protein